MIKIIFSDMDGTLLEENGDLPQEFPAVMAELKKRGVIFAPTSGRQYFALVKQLQEYQNDFLFLAENGTYAGYQGKELFSSIIDKEEYHKLLNKMLEMPNVYPVVCGKKCSYITAKWRPFLEELDKFYTQFQIVDDFSDIDDEFIKMALADLDQQNAEVNIYEQLADFPTKLHMTLSSNIWVDFLNPEVSKGWAVRRIQEMWNIKPEECAAFGDYLNDYEMMSSVYYSYAMENAHPELKKVARFQAASNKEHGVLKQIQQFIDSGLI